MKESGFNIVRGSGHSPRTLVGAKEERPSHWSLPGGGVEWGESTIVTLHREMQNAGRVVWRSDSGTIGMNHRKNFFTFEGEAYHEIGFYYLMRLPTDTPFLNEAAPFTVEENHLLFRWVPVSQLEKTKCFIRFVCAKE